jgi:hypothetical protein
LLLEPARWLMLTHRCLGLPSTHARLGDWLAAGCDAVVTSDARTAADDSTSDPHSAVLASAVIPMPIESDPDASSSFAISRDWIRFTNGSSIRTAHSVFHYLFCHTPSNSFLKPHESKSEHQPSHTLCVIHGHNRPSDPTTMPYGPVACPRLSRCASCRRRPAPPTHAAILAASAGQRTGQSGLDRPRACAARSSRRAHAHRG